MILITYSVYEERTMNEEQANMNTENTHALDLASTPKFASGKEARDAWAKKITAENSTTTTEYNALCGGKFELKGEIVLDDDPKRQTTLRVARCVHDEVWNEKTEHIYLLVRDGVIMKIGGTRTGLKERWSSYLCGHCVTQRLKKSTGEAFPGKMSVTNAHLYHTIEKDLLDTGAKWEIWSWKLPVVKINVEILDEQVEVVAQTYHAFESICINKFKKVTGKIPLLCDNSDPNY